MEVSQLFDDLYRQATSREHVRLRQAAQMKADPLDTFPWPVAGRVIGGMKSLADAFDDELVRTARQSGLRVRRGTFQCPFCKNPDCPDAVFVPEGYVLLHPQEAKAFISNFFG